MAETEAVSAVASAEVVAVIEVANEAAGVDLPAAVSPAALPVVGSLVEAGLLAAVAADSIPVR